MDSSRQQHVIILLTRTLVFAGLLLAIAAWDSNQASQTHSLAPVAVSVSTPAVVNSPQPKIHVESPTDTGDTPPEPIAPDPQSVRDAELRSLLVGVWTHTENGQLWSENRPDGTSRSMLKLDFVASLLYGSEVNLQLTWEVKNGILTHTILDGTPPKSLKALTRDFGRIRSYTIVETTPDRMLLETRDGKKHRELWTRVPPPKEWQ